MHREGIKMTYVLRRNYSGSIVETCFVSLFLYKANITNLPLMINLKHTVMDYGYLNSSCK